VLSCLLDLVLAMHLRGDAVTAEQKAANFAYYERLTVRDSSLSACTQAVIAAEASRLGPSTGQSRARCAGWHLCSGHLRIQLARRRPTPAPAVSPHRAP
jgi:Glycosyl hydrolase family 65 central catalytic domain